jgi:opacity protein-like surface antigen
MKKLLLAATTISLVGVANAQSAFEGFYGQVGAGYESNSVDSASLNVTGVTGPINAPSVSSNNAQINIGLGYNLNVTKNYLLGFGAEYSTLNSSSMTTGQSTNTATCGGICNNTAQYKISNRYSIFVSPAYVVSKEALAYAKLGYSNQTLKGTEVQTSGFDRNHLSSKTSSVGGYILGLGYKQIISDGFYGFGEFNYYTYDKANLNGTKPSGAVVTNYNVASTAYSFILGVGYRF